MEPEPSLPREESIHDGYVSDKQGLLENQGSDGENDEVPENRVSSLPNKNNFADLSVLRQLWYLLKDFFILIPILFVGSILLSSIRAIQTQIIYLELGGNISQSAEASAVCKNSTNDGQTSDDDIQKEATRYAMYMEIGSSLAALIFVPFWATVSDMKGRHYQLIAAMLGSVIKGASFLIVLLTHAPAWLLIVGDTLHGMFGKSTPTLVLASAAYCSDFTPYGSRTVMMFAIDSIILSASAIGSLVTGYWVKASGYVPYLSALVIVQSLVIVYILVVFRRFAKPIPASTQTPDSFCNATKKYFIGTLSALFKNRDTNEYTKLFLILLAAICLFYNIPYYACNVILGTYLLGPPLCWGPVIMGYFRAVSVTAEAIVPLGISLIFFKQGPSPWLMLVGFICGALCFIMFGLAKSAALMLIAVVVGSARLLVSGVLRSKMVDYVEANEQGSILGAYGITSVLSDLIASVAFVNLYAATVSWSRGFVFFLAAGLYGIAILILGAFDIARKRYAKSDIQLLEFED